MRGERNEWKLIVLLVMAGVLLWHGPIWSGESQGSPIWTFEDGEPVRGSATLTRDAKGITFIWNPSELPRHNAYTTWIVAFNHPENCETPNLCGEGDLFSEAVDTGIIWGGGGVSDRYGQVTIGGSLAFDDTTTPPIVIGPGITSPEAEVHLVLRRHFKAYANEEKREEQLTTFNVGCDGDCPDTHFSIFSPP